MILKFQLIFVKLSVQRPELTRTSSSSLRAVKRLDRLEEVGGRQGIRHKICGCLKVHPGDPILREKPVKEKDKIYKSFIIKTLPSRLIKEEAHFYVDLENRFQCPSDSNILTLRHLILCLLCSLLLILRILALFVLKGYFAHDFDESIFLTSCSREIITADQMSRKV